MYKTIAAKALSKLLHDQKGIVQRKDSITLFLVSVVWLASLLTPYLTGLPIWVGAVVGGVASVAGILLVALTKGAITPSMVTRAEKAAEEIEREEPTPAPSTPSQPVSDAPEPVIEASTNTDDYIGEHRLEETNGGGIAGHYRND